jgi:cysteine desulfurase
VLLDAAAGLPLHPAAREALLAAQDDGWADPAKLYAAGRRARLLLDGAREALAAALGARPDELVLPPGGCAAARWAVQGSRRRAAGHVVHSAVEHSCVLHAAGEGPATAVPVDRLGRVDPAGYAAALQEDTALACLIAASHEVGTLQPVAEVAQVCAAQGVPLHVDAAPLVGRAPVPPGWSLLTADARTWGGPSSVGVLAVRTGTRWRSPLPGTREDLVDLPAVLAAAVGLQAVLAEREAEDARLRPLVARVRAQVAATVPDVEVVGDPDARLPHLVTFSCLYADGEALLTALDREGFAVSSGSSCTSDTLEPSHVLVAMGVLTHGNVRVSLHRGTTEEDVDRFLAVLPGVVADVRRAGGAEGL